MSELVTIRTFINHIEADLARSALEAMGIESLVAADDAGGLQPGLWASESVRLLVRAEDAAWAADVLESASRITPEPAA